MENYKVIKKLGKGAQGSVFLAQDKRDGTQVGIYNLESRSWIVLTLLIHLSAVCAEEG